MDTAKLTAAVETLQLYCEQVRHVMVARGYPSARVEVEVAAGGPGWGRDYAICVRDDRDSVRESGRRYFPLTAFAEALAYAESRPQQATLADVAATLGITPDGRVLEVVEG